MATKKQEIGIAVSTDLKQSVAAFQQMQKLLAEQKRALLDAQAATGSAAKAWKDAQNQADSLRVQWALGKRELEAQAQATGKASVEYLSLKQAVAALEKDLKQADSTAKAALGTFEKQRAATQKLAAATADQSQSREKARRALIAEGVDVGRLATEYKRLSEQQAARQNLANARSTLGIRGASEIEAEIGKIKAAYQTLAASGRASLGELSRAQLAMRQQIREIEAETTGWGRALDKIKVQLLGLSIAGAVGVRFGGQGAGDLAEFNKQIALISTLSDKTPAQLAPLGKAIRQLAQDLGVSAKGAAEANYGIVSSDVAVEKSTTVLKQAIKAAIAGVTDTQTAAEVGLGVMHAYGYEVDKLGRIYDVLFQTVNKGVVTFPELSHQVGDVLPAARAAGVGLETVGAAMATLTLNAIKAPQAATALKSAILQLAAPTAESAKALDQYGIKWTGLIGTLEQIKAKNLSLDAVMKIVGDRDAAAGVLALTSDLDRLKRLLGEITDSAGAFESAFGKLNGTDDAKIRQFNAAFEEFKMVVGEGVLTLTPALQALTRLIRAYNELPGPMQTVVGLTTVLGGGWLVFGRTIKTLAETLALLRAGLAGSAASATAAGAAVTGAQTAVAGAGRAVGTLRLGLFALPGAFALVGGAIALLELALDSFGKKSEKLPGKIEAALKQSRDNIKAMSAAPLDADLEALRGAKSEAQRRLSALPNRSALEQKIVQEKAAGFGEPIYLTRTLAEIDRLQSQIVQIDAQIAATLDQQKKLAAPLPAPTPTGQGGTAPALPERGKASPYDAQFAATEAKNNLPPGLLKAIGDVESEYNPKAVNPSGAKGLMQLMPDTASRYGVVDPFDAAQSIEGAGRYVAKLLQEMGGDVLKTIAAYNSLTAYKQARAGTFDFASLPAETRKYVGDVTGKLKDYGNLRIDVQAMEDQAQARKKAADAAKKLAEETAQFQGEQAKAGAEAQNRADQLATAQLEADYQARQITAQDYYARLDVLQSAASRRIVAALDADLAAERRLQEGRTAGTGEYLKGQERIFQIEQRIAEARDGATLAAQRNRIALDQAQKQQRLALADQLDQIKLRLLEMQQPGSPNLGSAVLSPAQSALVAQRIQVLKAQYRDLIEQLRQAGDAEGEAQVQSLIKAEAVQDFAGKMDQATEFGIQAARNIQSSFADFLFDPFKDGVKGMGVAFLEQLRRMVAEAASARLMKALVGKDFEKGVVGGLLGGWLGGASEPAGQQAAPRVGPPAPPGSQVVDGATKVPPGAFDGVLGEFEHGFTAMFDGDFFGGLGSIFEGGFGGIFQGLAQIADQLLFGSARTAASSNSAAGDALMALKLAGTAVGLLGAGGGINAAADAGAGNGLGAVGEAMGKAGAGANWGAGFASMQFHKGGVVGAGGERRALPAIAFARAPRYHGGGLAGLKPNEVPAVLMGGPKGQREEVLRADDPRHIDNQGHGDRQRPAAPPERPVAIATFFDPEEAASWLDNKKGHQVILHAISRNPGAVNNVLGRGRG